MNYEQLTISVPTIFGVESLVSREIKSLGYHDCLTVEDGRVSFSGDLRAVCKANIWLRTAERVQIKVGDFFATDFTTLFDAVKQLSWTRFLPQDAAFPIKGHCLSSKLSSVPSCQSIIKKAVVESLKSKYRCERFKETGSLYRIQFNIIRDRVTLYIDTTGDGLHKRGYREESTLAPIKETLAAALVQLSGWRAGMGLWDPFAGSGTIVIEAAMMAQNIAPGINRRFAAESWDVPGFKNTWADVRADAREKNKSLSVSSTADSKILFVGSDLERHAVFTARKNAKRAGVGDVTRFFWADAEKMSKTDPKIAECGACFPARSVLVTNPPYGERLDDMEAARHTMREWKNALADFFDWSWCIISAHEDFESEIGRKAEKRRKLYNGRIKCNAFLYKP